MLYNTSSEFQAIDYIRELNQQIEATNTNLHNVQSDQWWLQLFNNSQNIKIVKLSEI